MNFHKYIDNRQHLVVIVKTIFGRLIAGYTEQCFNSTGIKKGQAMLFSLWNQTFYMINKNSKGVTYDEYYIIFGNSELRIKSLETKIFSNFGIKNAYFDNRGDKI